MNSKELTVLESFLSSHQADQSSQFISKTQPMQTHRLNMRHRRMKAEYMQNVEETSLSYSNISNNSPFVKQLKMKPDLNIAQNVNHSYRRQSTGASSVNKENQSSLTNGVAKITSNEEGYYALKNTLAKIGSARNTPRASQQTVLPHLDKRFSQQYEKKTETFSIVKELQALEMNETKTIVNQDNSLQVSTGVSMVCHQQNLTFPDENLFEDNTPFTVILEDSIINKQKHTKEVDIKPLSSAIEETKMYLKKTQNKFDTSDISIIIDEPMPTQKINRRNELEADLRQLIQKYVIKR